MITTVPRMLVAAISWIAVAAAARTPALAADCSGDAEPRSAECEVRKTVRRPTVRSLAAQLPAALQDEEISSALIEPPLAFDIGDYELFQKFDPSRAIPGTQLVRPPPLQSPQATSTVGTTGLATWSKLDKDPAREDARSTGGVGVNYRASQAATFGMAVENQQNAAGASRSEQSTLAATFGLKSSPLLSFEAKAAWARQSNGDVASRGAQSGQNALSARVDGDWRLGGFKLAPSVSVAHATEAGEADAAKAQKGTVTIAPSVSRPFALDRSQALEPFLTFKQEIDIGSATAQTGTGTKIESFRSVGAGVKLERKDDYSLSLTTDVENLEAERHSLKSQLHLSLPLR